MGFLYRSTKPKTLNLSPRVQVKTLGFLYRSTKPKNLNLSPRVQVITDGLLQIDYEPPIVKKKLELVT